MPCQKYLLFICTTLLGIAPSVPVQAQEVELEQTISAASSSAVNYEQRSQATAEAPKTEDRHELAVFYHKRGMARYRLGLYLQAAEDLELALINNQPSRLTPNGWGDRWQIELDLGAAYERRSWVKYIEFQKRVDDEWRSTNPFRSFYARIKVMQGYGAIGQWDHAEQTRKSADELLVQLRSLGGFSRSNVVSRFDFRSGELLFYQGRYAEAETKYRSSLLNGERYLELLKSSSTSPNASQAVRVEMQSLGVTKRRLGLSLASQGKYGEAEMYARAGLDSALGLYSFSSAAVSEGLAAVGSSRLQQGDTQGAEKYFRLALTAMERAEGTGATLALATRRALLANVLAMQERWPEALEIYASRDKGLHSVGRNSNSDEVGWALVLHRMGQSERAVQMVQRMLAVRAKSPVPNPYRVAQLQGVLALAQATQNRDTEALEAFQLAIPELTRPDTGDLDTAGPLRAFWRHLVLEGYVDLLAKLNALGSAPSSLDPVDESLRVADLARGSSVQQAISASAARAQVPDAGLAALVRKDQDTLNRIDALNKALARLATSSEENRLNKVISDMQAEIARSQKEHVVSLAEIAKRYPEYAQLIDPHPPSFAEVIKSLASDEALISIYLGESNAYVWTIGTGGKTAFRVLPVTRREIESDVAKLRRTVEFGDPSVAAVRPFDFKTAQKLYRIFFSSDEALWKDAKILNIVPHGALGQLSFGLLVAGDVTNTEGDLAYQQTPWLVRKVAIAHLPSTSAFTALRRSPESRAIRQPFVGFGNPVFHADAIAGLHRGGVRNLMLAQAVDTTEERVNAVAQGKKPLEANSAPRLTLGSAFGLLSPLPDTAEELTETAASLGANLERDVFLGRRATERNVKQMKLDDRRVVSFATHGIAPGELIGLDQPALALSNPAVTGEKDEDGFLTMDEVLGLKLDADWVVLSACNTASADGKGAEAVSGLGRAFFYAGARGLLVSNWAVETTSARMLTTELFRQQVVSPALSRAEALRSSMIALIDRSNSSGMATGSGLNYAHPAFWAPFALFGDSGARREGRN